MKLKKIMKLASYTFALSTSFIWNSNIINAQNIDNYNARVNNSIPMTQEEEDRLINNYYFDVSRLNQNSKTKNNISKVKKPILPKELEGIDFSKPLSQKEKDKVIKYQREVSKEVMSDSFVEKKLQQSKSEVENNIEDKTLTDKDALSEKQLLRNISKNPDALGEVGNILVTYSFTSLGTEFGVPGHAAIVHTDHNFTVESFQNKFFKDKEDGVRGYHNRWKKEANCYGLTINGASYNDYVNASNYAIAQARSKKPYNFNFFNKATTDSFYCSQLVWKAWSNQGFDVDYINGGNYDPVSPAEIVKSGATHAYYHK